ncbi:MAG: RsmE family RNA methyltransferase [Myxococcota bacterium]
MSKHFRVPEVLGVGARVAVDGHRFVRVLRARAGSTFTVCDGAGALWQARVTGLEPFALDVVGPAAAPDRNPSVELEVWVPLLKGGRTDDLVRQLTELGATRIVPFASRHAVVRLDAARAADRHQRMQAIVREAGNQCGRTLLPEVAAPVDGLPSAGPGAFLWEGGGAPAREVLAGGAARILVGPEGGLGDDEAQRLGALGWTAATLGPRILRAETAVVTFTVMALAALGEL